MNIIYLVTDSILGIKYLGSKKNWLGPGSYFGTPSIKTIGHPKFKIQQQWKINVKNRPETFILEILERVIDFQILQERELYYQQQYNVVRSTEFINGGYARKNFYSILKGHKFDKKHIKSLKQKGVWNTTEEQKEKIRKAQTGKTYSDETNKKKGRAGRLNANAQKIQVDDIIYQTINEAATALDVVRQTIRRRVITLDNYNYV